MQKHFAIIGYPVKQTLSPVMHNAGFAHFGLDCLYEAKEIEPDTLEPALRRLASEGFVGFNVTIPFKEKVQPLLATLSPEARASGAVNMIHVRSEGWFGHNTDSIGILRTLEPYKKRIAGGTVLILGAGGAARSVVYILSQHFTPEKILLAARTQSRANALATLTRASAVEFQSVPFDDTVLRECASTAALIVNTTPIGMYPNTSLSPLPENTVLSTDQILYDVIYRPLKTKFLQQGEKAGATTIGGLTMFMHQGAEAFKIWTGKEMPLDVIRPILLKALQA